MGVRWLCVAAVAGAAVLASGAMVWAEQESNATSPLPSRDGGTATSRSEASPDSNADRGATKEPETDAAAREPVHQPVRFLEGLGHHTYPISTKIPQAQRYFDQGLILAFGFNHAEAAASFREAARLDPSCAMCYWGEALVLGPNINAPMAASAVPVAYAAILRARALMMSGTSKERALINALYERYSTKVLKNRQSLDQSYAQAMKGVYVRFPDDAVIGALYAEALMDLHPWDYWTQSMEARVWTAEIIEVLEEVLDDAPEHPLANHLYIHMLEASPFPERALLSAERLATLVPGSGHLVHMPAHIYIRLGRYRDAALANERAVKVDQRYLDHAHTTSIYTAGYVPHNYHFLWAAAAKSGQQRLADSAASGAAEHVDPDMMRDPDFGPTLQHFWVLPLYTKALFGDWDGILQSPKPPVDLSYPMAVWHYARGLARVRTGNLEQAKRELAGLYRITKKPEVGEMLIFDVNPVGTLLEIGKNVLMGEIEASRGKYSMAVSYLRQAVTLEDDLQYTEPKDWYLPPRLVLGAVLLEAERAVEAEAVYRQDLQIHPHHGWSLFGLLQSLRAQRRQDEALEVEQQFLEAWVDADVMLSRSRF